MIKSTLLKDETLNASEEDKFVLLCSMDLRTGLKKRYKDMVNEHSIRHNLSSFGLVSHGVKFGHAHKIRKYFRYLKSYHEIHQIIFQS